MVRSRLAQTANRRFSTSGVNLVMVRLQISGGKNMRCHSELGTAQVIISEDRSPSQPGWTSSDRC